MASRLAALLLALALGANAAAPSPPGWKDVGMILWPYPSQEPEFGSDTLPISSALEFQCATSACSKSPELADAFSRYHNIIFVAGNASTSGLSRVTVHVGAIEDLQFGMNESYALKVASSGATIEAPSQWGALRAIETFSQLVEWDRDAPKGSANYVVRNSPLMVKDHPRFAWRGVLLDSSRHFLTMDAIKSTLDAMSYSKYNTLHWHLVDDQSWPIVSEKFPKFTEAGAYDRTATYTHDDVRELVTYARNRGIRVVPEFDMPAHASVWGKAYPDLVINCTGGETLLDPTGDVYPVLKGLVAEFSELFPDHFLHLGGDEVWTLKCWNESAAVQTFMTKQGFTDVKQVRSYFEKQVEAIAIKAGKRPILWEEVFDGGFYEAPTTVVNVWFTQDKMKKVLEAGFAAINSYSWYLDQQQPPGGTHYLWEDTWINFYNYDPLPNTTTPAQEALLWGGEASQWGEQVDATNIHSRMWPRACAQAERLWSPASINDADAAMPRLAYHRCRMVQRGIGAGPIRPSANFGFCKLPPGSPFL